MAVYCGKAIQCEKWTKPSKKKKKTQTDIIEVAVLLSVKAESSTYEYLPDCVFSHLMSLCCVLLNLTDTPIPPDTSALQLQFYFAEATPTVERKLPCVTTMLH